MDTIAYLIPSLGCALMMGALMWLVMRTGSGNDARSQRDDELAALRQQVSDLTATPPSDRTPAPPHA